MGAERDHLQGSVPELIARLWAYAISPSTFEQYGKELKQFLAHVQMAGIPISTTQQLEGEVDRSVSNVRCKAVDGLDPGRGRFGSSGEFLPRDAHEVLVEGDGIDVIRQTGGIETIEWIAIVIRARLDSRAGKMETPIQTATGFAGSHITEKKTGMNFMIACCVGSVAVLGVNFCCAHIVTPSTRGKMPRGSLKDRSQKYRNGVW